MQSGLFTREGQYLVGRIGDLTLKWDRHAGGKLVVALGGGGGLIEVGNFTMGAEVEVEVGPRPGLWLASQRWDERQNLLLFSSAHPQGNLGSLSLLELKMRDLKIPGYSEPVMARLPLYWFQANAKSAHHCLNHPKANRFAGEWSGGSPLSGRGAESGGYGPIRNRGSHALSAGPVAL